MLTREQILKACPTPEDALQAMVDGLAAPKPENFRIAMWTFGDNFSDMDSGKQICCGCAATYTVCQIIGFDKVIKDVELQKELFVSHHVDERSDLGTFEAALDHARSLQLSPLYHWYAEPYPFNVNLILSESLYLDNEFTPAILDEWRRLIKTLRNLRKLSYTLR